MFTSSYLEYMCNFFTIAWYGRFIPLLRNRVKLIKKKKTEITSRGHVSAINGEYVCVCVCVSFCFFFRDHHSILRMWVTVSAGLWKDIEKLQIIFRTIKIIRWMDGLNFYYCYNSAFIEFYPEWLAVQTEFFFSIPTNKKKRKF